MIKITLHCSKCHEPSPTGCRCSMLTIDPKDMMCKSCRKYGFHSTEQEIMAQQEAELKYAKLRGWLR